MNPKKIEDGQWAAAQEYFRARGGVIFLSNCAFWGTHPMVQQSLANALADSGIAVIWFDGAGWRPRRFHFEGVPSENLSVRQLVALPGRRVGFLDRATIDLQAEIIKKQISRLGGNPVIWVEAGIDERLAQALPFIDVFSVFDDPYIHDPKGPLCQKAKVVFTQNSFAFRLLKPTLKNKLELSLPPFSVDPEKFGAFEKVDLPKNFPKKRMGFFGSFQSTRFDLPLFAQFVRRLPDWGFLLVGRTDEVGENWLRTMKSHSNFVRFAPVPRSKLSSFWKAIDVGLLFYTDGGRIQHGAFATKTLEAFYFGVPCVATVSRLTEDLDGLCPRGTSPDELMDLAKAAAQTSPQSIAETFSRLNSKMDPLAHLANVAELLRG